MIKCVLFDIDDTIFDHKYSRICGLNALKNIHQSISCVPIEELEAEHERLLMGNYLKTLDKQISFNDAICERIFLLFKKFGVELSEDNSKTYVQIYRDTYESNRRAIPGVIELMKHIRNFVKIGIVSNGIYDMQYEKLKICGAENYIDFMIISEEVGVRKPDKAIFAAALEKAGVKQDETVFIGDSWNSDIEGALNCGLKAVWLNRYNDVFKEMNSVKEITSYDNMEEILEFIDS